MTLLYFSSVLMMLLILFPNDIIGKELSMNKGKKGKKTIAIPTKLTVPKDGKWNVKMNKLKLKKTKGTKLNTVDKSDVPRRCSSNLKIIEEIDSLLCDSLIDCSGKQNICLQEGGKCVPAPACSIPSRVFTRETPVRCVDPRLKMAITPSRCNGLTDCFNEDIGMDDNLCTRENEICMEIPLCDENEPPLPVQIISAYKCVSEGFEMTAFNENQCDGLTNCHNEDIGMDPALCTRKGDTCREISVCDEIGPPLPVQNIPVFKCVSEGFQMTAFNVNQCDGLTDCYNEDVGIDRTLCTRNGETCMEMSLCDFIRPPLPAQNMPVF